ncbi:PKD-like domain-containing protein [Mucilaginibacter sp.]|uniref:Ig-like domain-containing protein n=1 Tax=Mucilaginibacter sp. TaxID=1882438 RepID=UPI0025E0D512|nr:PKD-like domain-containing protein [Mucilaginibacter sp.]
MKSRLLIFIFYLLSIPLRGYSQSCTLNVSISSSEPAICAGNTLALTAVPTGGSGSYNYAWSTGETINPIHVNKAGKYTITITDKVSGCVAHNDITINVTPTPSAPGVKGGGIVCQGNSAHLEVTTPADSYQWYTQPTGGNSFHSGPTYDTDPIRGGTVFYVEATVGGCTSLRTSVVINVASRPVTQNAQACYGTPVTLSVSGGDNFRWYTSISSTNAINTGPTLSIAALTNTVTYYVEADVNGCVSQRTAVTATVTAAPTVPTITGNNLAICAGSVITLHATTPAGVVEWYNTPSGGTPLISSPDYTTQPLTANTTFYVQTSLNNCESSRVPVTVTVNPMPAAPAQQTVNACYNSSAHLNVGATTVIYQWYADAGGKHFLKQGNTYDTPVLTHDVTYYVMTINAGCSSALSPVNVIVSPPVLAPSVLTPPITCYGSSAELTVTSPGGIYQWFKTATDNNALPTTENGKFTTPPLTNTTTYYVQTTIGGCTSPRTVVEIPVFGQIPTPLTHDATTCAGNSATLTATGANGDYMWYDAGGNLVNAGSIFNTPALTANTSYYVQVTVNGCTSQRAIANVIVSPLPNEPIVGSDVTICPGNKANLSASVPAGQTIKWYDVPTGGSSIYTGNAYTTPLLYNNTTYYVENVSGTCSSTRKAINVIMDVTSTRFQYPSGTVATTGANPTPSILNPTTDDVFSAAPAGIVFLNNSTGQINISASAPGTYSVTLTSSGACSGAYTSSITISDMPKTDFTYNTPICRDGVNPLPSFLPGASAGVFTATPVGLVFANKNTGEIDLANSKSGTYSITSTIPPSGNFAGVFSSSPITIDEPVRVSAGANRNVPINTPVTLEGIISGATGTWSGGAGSFSDVNDPHAVYTPALGESNVQLTFLSNNPPGPCQRKSALVTIVFNNMPPAPTVKPAGICAGTSTILKATAPGGTYNWYKDATGGSSLRSDPNFQTPVLTATTTYYVETTFNGLTSPRTPVTVTVYDIPPTPVLASDIVTICSGGTAQIIASGSPGTYQWFNETGQPVAVGNTLQTTPLTTTTFYTVQSVIGQCVSAMKKVVVQVNQVPNITSSLFDFVCSSNPLNYIITADLPSATFQWERSAVPGISNPAVSAQTSNAITETLINTTPNLINVTYAITPINGDCIGTPVNYVVTVYPTPTVTSSAQDDVCYGTTDNYVIKFNTPTTRFSWSRAAIPGISNVAVSGQAAETIREVLFNTTNAPLDATYIINYKTNDCDGIPFNRVVTVYPQINITSNALSSSCSNTPQGYTITSNVPTATFEWQRKAVAGISNPAATNTGPLIDEALTNTTNTAIRVTYIITPTAYGCTGLPFTHTVIINPKPDVPIANSNSPICVGSTIQLNTPPINGASYMWTGPNGFSSTSQNPNIPASEATAGTYNLFVTVGGCTSDGSPVTVQVNQPPVAKADGPRLVCTAVTSIALTGSVTGGTTTGVWTSSNPKGKFLPFATQVDNVQYIPTQEEKAAGSVIITLSSTSKDDCTISSSSLVITYGQEPGADAGPPNIDVCSQDTRIPLAGKILVPGASGFWTTSSGDGKFESGNQPNAVYLPGDNDKKNGSVVLTFNVNNSGQCFTPSDFVKITFFGPPALTTEHVRYVLKDKTITLHPNVNVSDETVTYLWSPNINISDVNVKNPVITGDIDRTYTLVVTDALGCTTADTTHIIVSPQLFVNNAFSPNGDGKNDTWEIAGLIAFENSTVDVYNRYGTQLFHSKGYGVPWDGKSNGQPVPVGVYYFIVDTKVNGGQKFTGYVTILR